MAIRKTFSYTVDRYLDYDWTKNKTNVYVVMVCDWIKLYRMYNEPRSWYSRINGIGADTFANIYVTRVFQEYLFSHSSISRGLVF